MTTYQLSYIPVRWANFDEVAMTNAPPERVGKCPRDLASKCSLCPHFKLMIDAERFDKFACLDMRYDEVKVHVHDAKLPGNPPAIMVSYREQILGSMLLARKPEKTVYNALEMSETYPDIINYVQNMVNDRIHHTSDTALVTETKERAFYHENLTIKTGI